MENRNGNLDPNSYGGGWARQGGQSAQQSLVFINSSKGEKFNARNGYRQLFRKLKNTFNVQENSDDLTRDRIAEANVIVFGAPTHQFSAAEFEDIEAFLADGGSVLVLMGEGGEEKLGTNVNFILEQFGISVNGDSVASSVYTKYVHPKEALISDGVINREISAQVTAARAANGKDESRSYGMDTTRPFGESNSDGVNFVFPYGSTLNVMKPAIPILSSGSVAFPMNRPIAAVFCHRGGKGRLAVVGSAKVFDDEWLNKEDNARLADVIFKYLVPSEGVSMHEGDADEPEVMERTSVPDTESLSERVRSCLQEADELPRDFSTLFSDRVFKFDSDTVPDVIDLYKSLDVKHAPLTLIPPQFETPLPPLQAAVFPPMLREPPPPSLDCFDLDDHFANEKVRLALLTNKCDTETDLEYYVREAGEILGVSAEVPPDSTNEYRAKAVLEKIFVSIVQWKKLNQS